jgi:hypothetical protein
MLLTYCPCPLPPPPPPPLAPWPPMIPGWTYYPGAMPYTYHTCNDMCYASSCDPISPNEGPPSDYCPDLPALLRHHQRQQDGMTAVTTCGCSLPEVPPSSCWRWSGDWGRGVYVPDVMRKQGGLELPPQPAKGESSLSHSAARGKAGKPL